MIPAGGSGKLVAKVHTSATQTGRLSKGVAVTTDAAGAERLTLGMSFTVQPAVEVRPGPRVLLQTVKGQPASQRLVLHRTDGKPLTVERFALDDPSLAHVKVEPVTAPGEQGAQPGDVIVEVAVAEGDRDGMHAGRLSLFTNHPDQAEVVVPLTVKVRPLIEPRPEKVQLWVDAGTTDGRSTSFRLTSNHDQPFQITGIVSSNPQLFTGTAVTTDSRLLQTVQVSIVDGADVASLASAVTGTLRISSDDPQQPLVEVPVVVSKRVRTGPAQARPVRKLEPPKPTGDPAPPVSASPEKG